MALHDDDAESRRMEAQASLDASRSPEERDARGQHGTPPSIAGEMARCVAGLLKESPQPIRYCEPFLGTAAFYSALRALLPKERFASALGIEIDADVAKAAAGLWIKQGLRIFQGDFAEVIRLAPELQRPNLIMCDPPAFPHDKLQAKYKLALQEQTAKASGLSVSGLAAYYVYAFLIACEWLQDGGLAAWLIPSEFMSENYGEVMKRYLTERASLVRVHRFDPKAAAPDDRWVNSAVVVVRKVPPRSDTETLFSFRGTLAEPAITQTLAVQELLSNRLWITFPSVRVQFEEQRRNGSTRPAP